MKENIIIFNCMSIFYVFLSYDDESLTLIMYVYMCVCMCVCVCYIVWYILSIMEFMLMLQNMKSVCIIYNC